MDALRAPVAAALFLHTRRFNQVTEYSLKFVVTRIEDAPVEFHDAMPVYAHIFDKLDNEDGSEYYLAELFKPITSNGKSIQYLVVGARFEGAAIGPNMSSLPVNASYVTDNSLLNQRYMDFDKGEFIGILEIDHFKGEIAMEEDENLKETKNMPEKWWMFWKRP